MNFLLVELAFAPLLVSAAPWNSSCKGLSEEAFIVIVVESVVILLLLVMVLFMWARIRRLRSSQASLAQNRHIERYVDRAPTPRAKNARDSSEDSELSTPFLPATVPEALQPRSMTLSTRREIGSPSLYVSAPALDKPTPSHQSTYTSRLSVAHPRDLSSDTPFPNPHSEEPSEDHSWLANEDAPSSPTVTTAPSIYSQPSLKPSEPKPASIEPLSVGKRLSATQPIQENGDAQAHGQEPIFPNPHSEGHAWHDDDTPLPSPTAPAGYQLPSAADSWVSYDLTNLPTPTDLSHRTTRSSFPDPSTPSARSLHIALQPSRTEVRLIAQGALAEASRGSVVTSGS